MPEAKHNVVGTAPVRRDAWAKVSGGARFVADLDVTGAWVGGVLRSSVARGRLRRIERDPGFDWKRVVVLTAADLRGVNAVPMINDDLPLLAERDITFATQPLALVAAPDRSTLAAALAALLPDVEPMEPVLDLDAALAGAPVVPGRDNVIADYTVENGDLAAGFAAGDRVVEGVYHTGLQEQLYLETQGVIASPHPDGGVIVQGSLQCPYYVHRALSVGLGLAEDMVVVRQTVTGGAFGGKEDYPSILALEAAQLALAARAPVRMIMDRHEDLAVTPKRHPSRISHRTAVREDGVITAAEIDVVLDAGAFTTLSPVVLSRCILHAAGVYRVPCVRIRGRAVATNTPPNGAFRGFGVPQAIFAVERQMDRIAAELGIDPVEIRRRNLLVDGDALPTGQVLADARAVRLVLDRALELARRTGPETAPAGHERRGTGVSLFFHGCGFTGDGEDRIATRLRVRWGGGQLEILTSNVEMGQGAGTVLPMIAAEALGLPAERIWLAPPDTTIVPNSGPTVASRTTMVVGRVLLEACEKLFAKVRRALGDAEGLPEQALEFKDGRFRSGDRDLGDFAAVADRVVGETTIEARYAPPPGQEWDAETHRGSAYQAYSWGCNVIETAVDPDTFEVRPLRLTAVVEIGRAIHPVLAAGQVEGGSLQALGWGALEEIKTRSGRYLNDRLATYIIPTTLDTPEMVVDLAELPSSRGPFGAKGLGELPMNGCAPALAASVQDAVGLSVSELPVSPERLLELSLARDAGADGSETP